MALTAFQNEETIRRCTKIGMQKVYNKPASQEDIREIFLLHFYDFGLENYHTFLKMEETLNQQAKLIIKEQINQGGEQIPIKRGWKYFPLII